jgi:norsolorinic acid ketoreductase
MTPSALPRKAKPHRHHSNRDLSHATSKSFFGLPTGTASRLIVVKTDASIESYPFDAVKELATQGIGHLDLVIANVGVPYV